MAGRQVHAAPWSMLGAKVVVTCKVFLGPWSDVTRFEQGALCKGGLCD